MASEGGKSHVETRTAGHKNARRAQPPGEVDILVARNERSGPSSATAARTPSPIRTVPSAPESHRVMLARRRALARGLYRRSGLGRHSSPTSPQPRRLCGTEYSSREVGKSVCRGVEESRSRGVEESRGYASVLLPPERSDTPCGGAAAGSPEAKPAPPVPKATPPDGV
jgi:hypothetical protein